MARGGTTKGGRGGGVGGISRGTECHGHLRSTHNWPAGKTVTMERACQSPKLRISRQKHSGSSANVRVGDSGRKGGAGITLVGCLGNVHLAGFLEKDDLGSTGMSAEVDDGG
jgi:hypothetical protein